MTKRKSVATKSIRATWPDTDKEYLRERYPHVTAAVVAAVLGKTVDQVYRKAKQLGLEKSPAFFASTASGRDNLNRHGACTRFPKGHVSWNKGTRGIQYSGMQRTQFKPGSRPRNAVSVGTVIKRPDGYLWIKIAEPKVWIQVHRKAWEDAHGPVPPGHVVRFRDGNTENCALDNLYLSTKRAVMLDNTLHNLPREITQIIQLRGLLTRQINKRSKS